MIIDQKFWTQWIFNYSIGEVLGIGAAATIGRFLFIGFSKAPNYQTSILPLGIAARNSYEYIDPFCYAS